MPTSRDQKNRSTASVALTAISVTSNTTRNGSWIDTKDLAALLFVYQGVITDGTYTPAVQESDDQSAITSVASDRIIGSLTALSAGNLVGSIGVHPTKRYVRLNITSASTSTGAHSVGAEAIAFDS